MTRIPSPDTHYPIRRSFPHSYVVELRQHAPQEYAATIGPHFLLGVDVDHVGAVLAIHAHGPAVTWAQSVIDDWLDSADKSLHCLLDRLSDSVGFGEIRVGGAKATSGSLRYVLREGIVSALEPLSGTVVAERDRAGRILAVTVAGDALVPASRLLSSAALRSRDDETSLSELVRQITPSP